MKLIFSVTIICTALQALACVAAPSTPLTARTPRIELANINGVQLQLSEQDGNCQLSTTQNQGTHTYPLKMQWPCGFHQNQKAEVRVKKVGTASYIIVEAFRRSEEAANECQTKLQSIQILDGKISISSHIAQVTSCPPFLWDSYVFTELF